MLFDSHCHIDLPAFDADREEVLQLARLAGVSDILLPAVNHTGWDNLLTYCKSDPGLHAALGLHPVFLKQHTASHINKLEATIEKSGAVAIGEIGLDFQLKQLDQYDQIKLFDQQLSVAKNQQLPAILHVRKAHDNVIKHLKSHQLTGGICHAFNGSLQQAYHYIDLGFKLGFGGMLTYPHSKKLRRLATELPLSALVLETDAPDMTGIKHQYQRNSPEYLPEVAETLSSIKKLSIEEVTASTYRNTCEILRLASKT